MAELNPSSKLSIWIHAARPKTLWAAVAPVLVGTALAAGDGAFHLLSTLAVLAFALLVQIGTNYCNDYADFKKGADTPERQGPLRITQAGLVSARAVLVATLLTFTLAMVVSLYIVARGGWPLLGLAALAVVAGALYTVGPYPLGYLGLGDVFVLIFFGPFAVAGTYYVQALAFRLDPIIAGLGPGLISVAILVVNNLRDASTDVQAGKRTLAVRFGTRFAKAEYVACIVGAALVPVCLWVRTGRHPGALAAVLVLPLAWPAIRSVRTVNGLALNPLLGQTAKLLLVYSVLFSAGWLI